MTDFETENTFQRQCSDMVYREVFASVSHVVHTLAQGYGSISHRDNADLAELCEQAFELAGPVEDWQEAAEQAGWTITHTAEGHEGENVFYQTEEPDIGRVIDTIDADEPDCWQRLCEEEDIEPYQWEVYEHWIVSDWLAGKLEEQGEKIERDFANLTVWARTTTGQSISMDNVIRVITKAMHAPVE